MSIASKQSHADELISGLGRCSRLSGYSMALLWGMALAIMTAGDMILSEARKRSAAASAYGSSLRTQKSSLTPTRREPPKCLVFYHIPKTAGVTSSHVLRLLAHELNWTVQSYYKQPLIYQQIPTLDRPRVQFNESMIHMGHNTPNFERITGTEHCAKLTILRPPVDRVLSAFYYHGHQDDDVDSCLLRLPDRIYRFFGNGQEQKCRLRFQYHNDVVRMFANHGSGWNSFNEKRYLVGPWVPYDVSRASLCDAQEHLLGMDEVCFLSSLRQCLDDFVKRTFNVTLHIPDQKLNVNKKRPRNISSSLLSKVAATNRFDNELYEFAWRRFGNRENK